MAKRRFILAAMLVCVYTSIYVSKLPSMSHVRLIAEEIIWWKRKKKKQQNLFRHFDFIASSLLFFLSSPLSFVFIRSFGRSFESLHILCSQRTQSNSWHCTPSLPYLRTNAICFNSFFSPSVLTIRYAHWVFFLLFVSSVRKHREFHCVTSIYTQKDILLQRKSKHQTPFFLFRFLWKTIAEHILNKTNPN